MYHIASCSFGKDSLAMKKFQNKQYGFYGNVFDMEKVFEESEGK